MKACKATLQPQTDRVAETISVLPDDASVTELMRSFVEVIADALPFGGRLGEAFAARLCLGVGLEPAAQGSPAADEDLVCELERGAGLAVVDDEEAALDQRVERGARAIADGQL